MGWGRISLEYHGQWSVAARFLQDDKVLICDWDRLLAVTNPGTQSRPFFRDWAPPDGGSAG